MDFDPNVVTRVIKEEVEDCQIEARYENNERAIA